MPITIENGGHAGPVAGQIIAQAGQRDLDRQQQDAHLSQQLQQQRDMTMMHIDAQADLQRQAADDAMKRTALQHGLQGQLQEQEYDNTIKKMQEQARLDASQFEYRFTAQQRQEIAKFNNARQTIASSNQWSPQEKAVAMQLLDLQQANIKPSAMPRDPSKPIYPDGKGVGDSWLDESGATVRRNEKGIPELIQRWDQGPAGQRAKAQAALEQKQIELKAKHEQEIIKLRLKLASEDVADKGPDGKPIMRARKPEEIEAIMQSVLGGGQQQKQEAPWYERAAKGGLQVTNTDKQLPPQIGMAQAYVRTLNARFGGFQGIPQDKRAAYIEAVNILRQVASQQPQ